MAKTAGIKHYSTILATSSGNRVPLVNRTQLNFMKRNADSPQRAANLSAVDDKTKD